MPHACRISRAATNPDSPPDLVGMARELQLRTVAEGVEDRSDWDCLRDLGCECAQGYFIGRPMPAEALPGWIAQWQERRLDLLAGAR